MSRGISPSPSPTPSSAPSIFPPSAVPESRTFSDSKSSRKSQTFDLDGDPTKLPEHVQIYLCLLATAKRGDGTRMIFPNPTRQPLEPASALITPPRLQRGLELLRSERRHRPTGQGRVFSNAVTSSDRPIYPFLPSNLDEAAVGRMVSMDDDDPESFVDRFGNSLVVTDYALPMPPLADGVGPDSMLHNIVSWLYSEMHPALLAANVERVTYVWDSDDDYEVVPKEKLDEYDDNWILGEIEARALFEVYSMRIAFKEGQYVDDVRHECPWIVPEVQVTFPKLGEGDSWVNHLPRYTEAI